MFSAKFWYVFVVVAIYSIISYWLTKHFPFLQKEHADYLPSFVGMCFGVSIISNLFFDYKDKNIKEIEAKITLNRLRIQTVEEDGSIYANPEFYRKILSAKEAVADLQTTNVTVQENLCGVLNWLSLISALVCLIVAYLNLYFNWSIFLLFPPPAYFVF